PEQLVQPAGDFLGAVAGARVEPEQGAVQPMAERGQRAGFAVPQRLPSLGGERVELRLLGAREVVRLERGRALRPDEGEAIGPGDDLTNDARHHATSASTKESRASLVLIYVLDSY